jgi:hypothetical protein
MGSSVWALDLGAPISVPVGEATLGVDKIVMFNGRPAYHLVSEARSNAFCDTFYVVRDLNESWLDARTLTSLGYSKKIREGKFFRDEWVLYDRDAGTFVNRKVSRDGSFSVRAGTIPARWTDLPRRSPAERSLAAVATPAAWRLLLARAEALRGRRPQRGQASVENGGGDVGAARARASRAGGGAGGGVGDAAAGDPAGGRPSPRTPDRAAARGRAR